MADKQSINIFNKYSYDSEVKSSSSFGSTPVVDQGLPVFGFQ